MIMEDIKLGMFVYHINLYDGHERMKVIGIREKQIELEGDYSGGTHNVCQSDWESREGIRFNRCE